jgi:hypothetical protein
MEDDEIKQIPQLVHGKKRKRDDEDNCFPFVDHFYLTLNAQRRSGKSYFIRKYIEKCHKKFDQIYLFNYSVQFDLEYRQALEKLPNVKVFSEFSIKDLEELFTKQEKCKSETIKKNEILQKEDKYNATRHYYRCPNILVVLDDVIDSGLLNFGSICDRYAERGRHVNISVMGSVQRQSASSRSIRINQDYTIFFRPNNLSETERFMNEYVPKACKKDFEEQFYQLFDKPYSFLLYDGQDTLARRFKLTNTEDLLKNKYEIVNFKELKKRTRGEEEKTELKKRKRGEEEKTELKKA